MITLPGIFAYLPQDIQDIIIAILDALNAEEYFISGFMQRQTTIETLKEHVFEYQKRVCCEYHTRAYCVKCRASEHMNDRVIRQHAFHSYRTMYGICKKCNTRMACLQPKSMTFSIYSFVIAFDEDTIRRYSTNEIQKAIIHCK
jgi:hypothetical protein